jgi:hypothetical protein
MWGFPAVFLKHADNTTLVRNYSAIVSGTKADIDEDTDIVLGSLHVRLELGPLQESHIVKHDDRERLAVLAMLVCDASSLPATLLAETEDRFVTVVLLFFFDTAFTWHGIAVVAVVFL